MKAFTVVLPWSRGSVNEQITVGKWIRSVSTVVAAVAVFAAAACGQTADGRIQGIVTDAAGTPMAGVRVTIMSDTEDFFAEIGLETDDEGRYQFAGLTSGTFEVTVHDRDGKKIGQGKSVAVDSGATATLNFSIPAGARWAYRRLRAVSHGA